MLLNTVIKENINIVDYEKTGKCRSKYDAVVRTKYPQAAIIYPLVRYKKLSMIEKLVDFIVSPGVLQAADSLNNISAYYLVELEQRQLLVNVTKEFIESRKLNSKFTEREILLGNYLFKKVPYTI